MVQKFVLEYKMTNSKILSDYSMKIPDEIKSIVKGLSDDDRLGIIIALLENGKMTFSEMKDKFEINSSSLVNHLNSLQDGNLVHNFYEKGKTRTFSYYDTTDLPESILEALLDVALKAKPTLEKTGIDEIVGQKEEEIELPLKTSKKIQSRPSYISSSMLQQPTSQVT
ncbi:MAG: winged helix-turn-helix transcriptional regulator [Nitrosopumilaceae archaeon]|nr:winged helix-turn-helix transcriptional regulator [Nitrosopumilaceae archaeon]